MRCAERGPTPGSTRSASIRRSRPAGLGTMSRFILERQFQPGRQPHARGQRAHFFLHGRLHLARGIIEGGDQQVLQHFPVRRKRRIDAHAARLVLAGHCNFHHSRAGLAFDLQRAQLLLHAAHVLLHHLRLLHHLSDIAFHRCFSRIVESTTLPSKRLTRSCTKPSPFTARAASACRAPRSAASSVAAVAPAVSPSVTCTFTGLPKCAVSAACSFSRNASPARCAIDFCTTRPKLPSACDFSSLLRASSFEPPESGSRCTSSGQLPSNADDCGPGLDCLVSFIAENFNSSGRKTSILSSVIRNPACSSGASGRSLRPCTAIW